MGALEELRERVERERAERDEAARVEEEHDQAAMLAAFQDEVQQALTVEICEELELRFVLDGEGYPIARFKYRGREGKIKREDRERVMVISGWKRPLVLGSYRYGLTDQLVSWLTETDEAVREHEEQLAALRIELLAALPQVDCRYDLERAHEKGAEFADDADVQAALAAAEKRYAMAVAEAEAERLRGHELMVAELLQKVAETDSFADLEYAERLCGYDERVVDAAACAAERIQVKEAMRKLAREGAEREAFYPFVWYRVTYAFIAIDDEGAGCAFLDTAFFRTLHAEPDADGWWFPFPPASVRRVAHLVSVERVECRTVEGMKDIGCPIRLTEWGWIQVPPEGCERL